MSNGAHALTEADLTAVREVWDTMEAASMATDWDTYQQHVTQDLVALDPRVAGPLRGRTAWREWIDSIGFGNPEIQFNVEEVSGSGDVAFIFWTGEGRWIEGGEQMEAQGKGLNLFRREVDGSWRLSHSAWNPNP